MKNDGFFAENRYKYVQKKHVAKLINMQFFINNYAISLIRKSRKLKNNEAITR